MKKLLNLPINIRNPLNLLWDFLYKKSRFVKNITFLRDVKCPTSRIDSEMNFSSIWETFFSKLSYFWRKVDFCYLYRSGSDHHQAAGSNSIFLFQNLPELTPTSNQLSHVSIKKNEQVAYANLLGSHLQNIRVCDFQLHNSV